MGASGRHGGNISLDVLPVKGPQGSPLLSQAARPPPDQLASEEPWTVLPEHLILVAPSPCEYVSCDTSEVCSGVWACTSFVPMAHPRHTWALAHWAVPCPGPASTVGDPTQTCLEQSPCPRATLLNEAPSSPVAEPHPCPQRYSIGAE